MALTVKEIVAKLIGVELAKEELYLKLATVSEVDADMETCVVEPLDNSATIENVRLKPAIQDRPAAIRMIPSLGSLAIVAFTDSSNAYLLNTIGIAGGSDEVALRSVSGIDLSSENLLFTASEIASMEAPQIGINGDQTDINGQDLGIAFSNTIQVQSPEITFNEGENGGMVLIKELTEKLNELRGSVNTLISRFNSHTHSGVSSGTANSGPKTGSNVASASEFIRTDYENSEITQ